MSIKRYNGKELLQHLIQVSIEELQNFLKLSEKIDTEQLQTVTLDIYKIEQLCLDLNYKFER